MKEEIQLSSKKQLLNFKIAGFSYYEGAIVFPQLAVGTQLRLEPELDNRYDKNAVALYFDDHKLGYMPRQENRIITRLLQLGVDCFEAYIQQLDATRNPEEQVGVILYGVKR